MAYDPRAVKIPKAIKRFAANETNPHKRGEIIRSFVKVLESESRSSKRGPKEK